MRAVSWLMVLFFSVIICSSFALAKDVTVVFDYPSGADFSDTVVVPDDANAYTAIVLAASNNSIPLDLVYYDGMGYFVNSLNGVSAPAENYWAFFINNVYSMTDGMSSFVPENNDIVGFSVVSFSFSPVDYNFTVIDSNGNKINADLFIDDSVSSFGSTGSDGELVKSLGLVNGTHTVIADDGSTTSSVNFSSDSTEKTVIITFTGSGSNDSIAADALNWLSENQNTSGEFGNGAVWGNAFALMGLSLYNGYSSETSNAIDYLFDNQGDDAGFSYPGFSSDALHTSVSILALTSNGYNMSDFDVNGNTSIGFVATKQENDGGFSGWGSGDVDTTSWSLVAFKSLGISLPEKNSLDGIDYLISAKNSDGGFPYAVGQISTVDYTAEALIGLGAQGYEKNSTVTSAIDFIKSKTDTDGCLTNVYYNSLAALAFNAYEEDSTNLVECIKNEQKSDGGFGRSTTSNAADTGLALIALSGETLPLVISNYGTDGNLVRLNDTIKLVLTITNTGTVSAENVNIDINGVDSSWVKEEVSTLSFSSIAPNETKTAEIYILVKDTGEYNVSANISANGLEDDVISNSVSFEVRSAELSAELVLVN